MDATTIALMLGDRYGIGPEIVAKYLAGAEAPDGVQIVVVGDQRVLESGQRCAGVDFSVQTIASFADGRRPGSTRLLLDRPAPAVSVEPLGRHSAEAGREVLDTLTYLVECACAGEIDGIVYAPMNKQSLKLAGMTQGDELSFIVELLGFDGNAGELNILHGFWTSRVTSHIPLRQVAGRVTKERVLAAIELIHDNLIDAGIENPKVAVSGLNPHAGDGGAFGDEEIEIIEPTIQAARAEGIDAHGPFSPDTVFLQARAGDYDAIVSMYHDQGQVAMKLMGFGEGVTLLGGLPFPIVTPAHGTAFDIAGKGMAKTRGLEAAIQICTAIAQSRHNSEPTLN